MVFVEVVKGATLIRGWRGFRKLSSGNRQHQALKITQRQLHSSYASRTHKIGDVSKTLRNVFCVDSKVKISLWAAIASMTALEARAQDVSFNKSSYSELLKFTQSENSLLIRDHVALKGVRAQLDFGYLLGQVSNHLVTDDDRRAELDRYLEKNGSMLLRPDLGLTMSERPGLEPGFFIETAFADALLDQNRHNIRPIKLGATLTEDRKMSRVFLNWMPPHQLRAANLEQLKNGPFRLLAIVNRMDLAGDMDDRGMSDTAGSPKAFGEIHMIYGLIDNAYENSPVPFAYPGLFVVAYRLPEIAMSPEGPRQTNRSQQSNRMIHHLTPSNNADWKRVMRHWSRLWLELSHYERSSPLFQQKLEQLLNLAVTPNNFVKVSSNFKVNPDQFELREFYVDNNKQILLKRRPRDEPYECLSGSEDLTKIVEHYWNSDYQDLDVTSRSLSDRKRFRGEDGYSIPKDGGVQGQLHRFSTLWEILPERVVYYTHKINESSSLQMPVIRQIGNHCGTAGNSPHEMHFTNLQTGYVVMSPVSQFGRVKQGRIWQLASRAMENQRHAFAIRSCTGCHGTEAGTHGFHIQPTLPGRDAQLSKFLTGGASFNHGNTTYKYNELWKRKQWLVKAAQENATLFESLKRHEAH
jgi:hypothetical protein